MPLSFDLDRTLEAEIQPAAPITPQPASDIPPQAQRSARPFLPYELQLLSDTGKQ